MVKGKLTQVMSWLLNGKPGVEEHIETWSVSVPTVAQNLILISLLGANEGLMDLKSYETV